VGIEKRSIGKVENKNDVQVREAVVKKRCNKEVNGCKSEFDCWLF